VRRNKSGDVQKFACLECKKYFTINLGFEKMKHNPQAITSAMQLYFSGESLRKTAESLRMIGAEVSHQTIHNWITKYVRLMEKYLDKITHQVSDTWRTDEIHLKVRGNMKYLFAMLDDQTRFWIAEKITDNKGTSDVRPMFRDAERAGKKPKFLISD
jgi:putative transposase